MTAARTGSVDAVQALLDARRQRQRARAVVRRDGADVGGGREPRRGGARCWSKPAPTVNARSTVLDAPVLEFPRSGGPNSPFPRGGWTALMFAAREGSIDAARALAELGADLNVVALPQTDVPLKPEEIEAAPTGRRHDARWSTPSSTRTSTSRRCCSRRAPIRTSPTWPAMAALYAAVDMNSLQWMQGRPAPIFTDKLDAVDLVKLLLQKGAEPQRAAEARRRSSAITTPARRSNFGDGATPLMRAARTNDVAVMKLLLDAGADPFLTLPDRTNALMIAAGQGYSGVRGEGIRIVVPTAEGAAEAVQLLLDRGMDLDAFNTAGNTALHGAVGRGEAVVKLLASRGATLNLKNKAGFTPLDLALGSGGRGRGGRGGVVREDIADLLRQLQGLPAPPAPSPAPVASAAP